jgi:antitoxin (DNA-binding transcriptional repressor) of toxin-antitoxin stability system
MFHNMKTATVRELRTEFPRIESWLSEGERVLITKHKKVVAELSPPRRKKKPDFARRFAPRPSKVRPGKSAVDLLFEERGI